MASAALRVYMKHVSRKKTIKSKQMNKCFNFVKIYHILNNLGLNAHLGMKI